MKTIVSVSIDLDELEALDKIAPKGQDISIKIQHGLEKVIYDPEKMGSMVTNLLKKEDTERQNNEMKKSKEKPTKKDTTITLEIGVASALMRAAKRIRTSKNSIIQMVIAGMTGNNII